MSRRILSQNAVASSAKAPARVLSALALAAAAVVVAPRANATTVLLIAHDSCTSMLNAWLPTDTITMSDCERDPNGWMSPCTDPGMMRWLATSMMGDIMDQSSPVQPVRDPDIISAFYAALAGMPNALFPNADFNGDGDVGTDMDIQAFWASLGGQGGDGNPESIPLAPAAALGIPGILALGLRRRR
jgi:hypothetical protein